MARLLWALPKKRRYVPVKSFWALAVSNRESITLGKPAPKSNWSVQGTMDLSTKKSLGW